MAEGITSLGAGSGLDLAGLVDQLVGAERQTRESRLVSSEARALSELSAFGQVKGAASAFQDSLETLQDLSSYRGRTATVSDEEALTATAGDQAATGRYGVEVVALAEAQKIRTGGYESSVEAIGTGTLTFADAENSFSIAIDDEANSLADIRDAINSATENRSITAGIVNSVEGAHLVLTSNQSGDDGAFIVTASGGNGGLSDLTFDGEGGESEFAVVNAAANAQLLVDGLEVEASGNLVSDAIEGVTIDLLRAEPGQTIDLNIGFDQDAARSQVTQFVQGYNNLLLTVGNQATFNAETFQSGPLFGDGAVRSLLNDVREVVNTPSPESSAAFASLAQIGITTEVDGSLTIDDAVLDDALTSGFEDVGLLFAGDDGLASRLGSLLGGYLEPSGRLTVRTDSLESEIEDFADQREVINERLETFEARIRRQFTSLDTLLSELNNTSTFLAQQLDSLPGPGSNG